MWKKENKNSLANPAGDRWGTLEAPTQSPSSLQKAGEQEEEEGGSGGEEARPPASAGPALQPHRPD